MVCTTYLYFYPFFVSLNNTHNGIKDGSRFERPAFTFNLLLFLNTGVMAAKHIWLKLVNTGRKSGN